MGLSLTHINQGPCVRQPDLLIPHALVRNVDHFGGVQRGDLLCGQPVWQSGRLAGLAAPRGEGRAVMVIPQLIEAHCHLDKCHTIHRLGHVGGDLAAAIDAQHADKVNWTADDLQARAAQGINEARTAGCGRIRSHVDWGDAVDPPESWHVLSELDATQVQWASLTGINQLAQDGFAEAQAAHVASANGVLGAFLLFHDAADIRAGLLAMFAAADRFGLPLDFHVDEGLGDYNGLEAIANVALETGFQGPILCGHAVSLMDRAPDDFARIADKLARAGITICALPTTNLYLQGRNGGTPDRRGITRLAELHGAGVPIVVASDNVGDAFCPVGQHDPMAALHLAVLGAHLDPPLGRWLASVTVDAARALGVEPTYLDGARPQDLLVSEAQSLADLISGRAALRSATDIFDGDHP